MSTSNNNSTIESTFFLTNTIKFWSFLIVLIPSIICSIFTLYHFLFDRTLRNTLHNHVIIVVLIIGFLGQITMYPWMLYYYRVEGAWERSFEFCLIWAFIDWMFYVFQTIVFAWGVIERHILIFHDRWMATKNKRLCFHYLPLISLTFYCIFFHIVIDFFLSCTNTLRNDYMICAHFCIYYDPIYSVWETVAHQFIPCAIVLIFSIALLVRIVWQKFRIRHLVQWRKHRKMPVQLLAIAFVYLLFFFPYICLNFMYQCGYPKIGKANIRDFLGYLTYFQLLFLPFPCMLTLPRLSNRMKYIIVCK